MTLRSHVRLFVAATIAWLVFWAIGLPDYYQQYSTTFMAWFDAIALVPLSAAFVYVLARAPRDRTLGLSLWMAFYFTVPIAIYDWLYCGIYLGHGIAFLGRSWYLTVYYAIPWLLLPALAAAINHRAAGPSPAAGMR